MKAKYGRQSVKGRENMNELSNDTLLSITYGDLKEMLAEFQTDGFAAFILTKTKKCRTRYSVGRYTS